MDKLLELERAQRSWKKLKLEIMGAERSSMEPEMRLKLKLNKFQFMKIPLMIQKPGER